MNWLASYASAAPIAKAAAMDRIHTITKDVQIAEKALQSGFTFGKVNLQKGNTMYGITATLNDIPFMTAQPAKTDMFNAAEYTYDLPQGKPFEVESSDPKKKEETKKSSEKESNLERIIATGLATYAALDKALEKPKFVSSRSPPKVKVQEVSSAAKYLEDSGMDLRIVSLYLNIMKLIVNKEYSSLADLLVATLDKKTAVTSLQIRDLLERICWELAATGKYKGIRELEKQAKLKPHMALVNFRIASRLEFKSAVKYINNITVIDLNRPYTSSEGRKMYFLMEPALYSMKNAKIAIPFLEKILDKSYNVNPNVGLARYTDKKFKVSEDFYPFLLPLVQAIVNRNYEAYDLLRKAGAVPNFMFNTSTAKNNTLFHILGEMVRDGVPFPNADKILDDLLANSIDFVNVTRQNDDGVVTPIEIMLFSRSPKLFGRLLSQSKDGGPVKVSRDLRTTAIQFGFANMLKVIDEVYPGWIPKGAKENREDMVKVVKVKKGDVIQKMGPLKKLARKIAVGK